MDNDGGSDHEERNSKRFQNSVDQSVFHQTSIEGSELVDYYWALLLGQRNWYNPTDADREGITNWLQSHNLNDHPILYIKDVLNKEYNGSPIPTVDLSSIPAFQPPKEPKACTCFQCSSLPSSKIHCHHGGYRDPYSVMPSIRLMPGRPSCSCHQNSPRSYVQAKERVRGTGLLPAMRLNYGAVWLACAEVFMKVKKSSKHKIADGGDAGLEGEDPVTCLCTVDHLLMDGEYCPGRHRRMKWLTNMLSRRLYQQEQ